MSKALLTELYIKSKKNKLSADEKQLHDQLRFKYPQYYQFLKERFDTGVLGDELMKINKTRSLKNLNDNIGGSRSTISHLVKVAAILIVGLIASVVVFQLSKIGNTTDFNLSLAQQKTDKYIKQTAHLITNERSFNLENDKKELAEEKNINIDSKNNLSYKAINSDTTKYHTIVTPYSTQYSVTLSDSSVIYLNSNSKIRYPIKFGSQKREIYAEGEVYCEIAKSTKPFTIISKGHKVTVLGTKFNLRTYENEGFTEVSLVEGSVMVCDGQNECILKPDEQVIINNGFEKRNVDAKLFASWRNDLIIYEDVSLERMIYSISQLYGLSFEFDNQILANRIIVGGIMKNQSAEENLLLLEKACNIKFVDQVDKILIKESPGR
ncbi:MAG: FecR family protein [Carboxylicivirga sp.]|jgi:type II secretory pathway pseudopilin PulG|nr:FecR family protein [Carboxylicivirga sp.]